MRFLHQLKCLWSHISFNRRRQFLLSLLLLIIVSFTEVMTIGAVLPFLAVLTSPEKAFSFPLMQPVIEFLGIKKPIDLLLPVTVLFSLAAVIAGFMRLILVKVTANLNMSIGAELASDVYRKTLYQPYLTHTKRNSSEVLSIVVDKVNVVVLQTVGPLMRIINAFFLASSIIFVLILIDPLIAISTMIGFTVVYFFVAILTRRRLFQIGRKMAFITPKVIKTVQEGLGGIRDVLIEGAQKPYSEAFDSNNLLKWKVQAGFQFISQSPRYGIEAISIVFISILAYLFAVKSENNFSEIIPVLGALALGAQRILPVLQQAYSSWSSVQASRPALSDVLEYLDQKIPEMIENGQSGALAFEKEISLKNVHFSYSEQGPAVIKGIDVSIPKGSRVGFVGPTGSGKSTLLDIIMGLLEPTEGDFMIDGQSVRVANQRSWQSHISHVPQDIFLADASVAENIAFGISPSQIEMDSVCQAATRAQIADTIEDWDDKYETVIGERGVRLSGGQRQRLGIARALYKNADLIILDEATSALDQETERKVMQAIDGLDQNLTILMIAHRITTLANCDFIVELSKGKIKRIAQYEDFI